jgi:hypothetical protein
MTHTGPPEHEGSIHMALQIKRWLLAFLGLGFWGLTVDVFLEHYFTIHSMRQPQWIPIVFGPLAGVMTLLAAWRFEAMTLRLFGLAAWISISIGGLGLYYHGVAVARFLESPLELLDVQVLFAVLPHTPPLGAPMAFVGMGVLGLLVHTCALKLEHLVRPRSLPANAVFALVFLLLVLAPLSPMLIHVLF